MQLRVLSCQFVSADRRLCTARERAREVKREATRVSSGGKKARRHLGAERLCALECVCLHASECAYVCSLLNLAGSQARSVFVHVAIFDLKTRVSLCVCVWSSPHSSLSTLTLALGLCGDLLSQLDCSPPPFSSDPSPPPSLTPLLLLYSHLHSGPVQLPSSRGEELKSLPSLCLSKGFLPPPIHTPLPVPPSLIVSRRGMGCDC